MGKGSEDKEDVNEGGEGRGGTLKGFGVFTCKDGEN